MSTHHRSEDIDLLIKQWGYANIGGEADSEELTTVISCDSDESAGLLEFPNPRFSVATDYNHCLQISLIQLRSSPVRSFFQSIGLDL